jgi:phosphoribosylformylglycinamidine synthase subunit PurS
MKARVTVTLKSGILDPQGKAIEGALKSLGVDGIASVRQGKVFDIELAGAELPGRTLELIFPSPLAGEGGERSEPGEGSYDSSFR